VSGGICFINKGTTQKTLHILEEEWELQYLPLHLAAQLIFGFDVLKVAIEGASNPFSMSMNDFLALPASDETASKLDYLAVGQEKTYTFKINFNENAGNEYQGLTSTFDLTFGVITGRAEAASTEESNVLSAITSLPNTGNPVVDKLILAAVSLLAIGVLIRFSLYLSGKAERK
jgi:hypothetical protein